MFQKELVLRLRNETSMTLLVQDSVIFFLYKGEHEILKKILPISLYMGEQDEVNMNKSETCSVIIASISSISA